MNTSTDTDSQIIQAREVPEHERLSMLPRHFGRHMLRVETAVYAFMSKLAPQYAGGYWRFVELSNGGFYIAPQSESDFSLIVETNGYEGTMTADAAGITVCLFAFSHLSFQIRDDKIADHYHALRDFALGHAEASEILAAID